MLPAPFYESRRQLAIDLPGARALFTTRRGGVSRGPYATFNLGRLTADKPSSVEQNRALLREQVGRPLAQIRQVHGTHVVRVQSTPEHQQEVEGRSEPPEADGQATASLSLAPLVLVADCLPIAIAGRGGVAMLHAGWRGLAAGIVAEGMRALRAVGGEPPYTAAIGPGARACCYAVGEEVHAAFAAHGDQVRRGCNLDLPAVARRELEAAGVETVHDIELCTICSDPGMLFSHRRDGGVTGRQGGLVWLN
jgi:YfiH family protein